MQWERSRNASRLSSLLRKGSQERQHLTLNGSTIQPWPSMRPTRRYAAGDSAVTGTALSLRQMTPGKCLFPGNRGKIHKLLQSPSKRDLHTSQRTQGHQMLALLNQSRLKRHKNTPLKEGRMCLNLANP